MAKQGTENAGEKINVEKLRELTESIVTAGSDDELNKLIDKEEKDMATVARRLRAVERTALPTFGRLDHKLSENPFYDAVKAGNNAVTTIRNGMDLYRLGKWAVEWFRS